MTFEHLTSNTMLCDNTFLCPRRLFSSPISSWLSSAQPWEATKVSLFLPPGVHKEHGMGQIYQSHLCCLDNTSPRLAFTSTSTAASGCSIPRLEELVPLTPCSCLPRGPHLFHSQVSFTSQERACLSTLDFPSQVNSLSRSCLQVHFWTFTQKSPHLSRTCLQMHWWLSLASHFTAVFIPFSKACHCGTVLISWCSHHAFVSLILQ